MKRFYSHGKLLLTGEYLVLDGAIGLALPTRSGQALEVNDSKDPGISWRSYDEKNQVWLEDEFQLTGSVVTGAKQDEVSQRLASILTEAHKMNPEMLSEERGYKLSTYLEFNRNWGLGSSSTLISNIAQWFDVDAYWLLKQTFGGSGYDIAAAQHSQPILYSLEEGKPSVLITSFDPPYKKNLFFVHLNKKQDSRQAIEHYRKQPRHELEAAITKINGLTHQILSCRSLEEFELLLEIHETLISNLINTPKIKTRLFPDYSKSIKSLGGWGGDFILATGGEEEKEYFRGKGYGTIIEYSKMVLT